MAPIFNTSSEYPRMHVWYKFGDSSSYVMRQMSYRADKVKFTDRRRQQYPFGFGLKGQGVKMIKFSDFNLKNEPRNAKIDWLIKWSIMQIFNEAEPP